MPTTPLLINWFKTWEGDTSKPPKGLDQSHKLAAQKIATEYDKMVKTCVYINQWGNGPLLTFKSIMQTIIQAAFNAAIKIKGAPSSADSIIERGFNIGTVLYWTGAQMKPAPPPPGSIQIVSNPVISPGIMSFKAPPTHYPMFDIWPKTMREAWRMHALTVGGITTSLTPMGSSTPPIPYPWIGLFCGGGGKPKKAKKIRYRKVKLTNKFGFSSTSALNVSAITGTSIAIGIIALPNIIDTAEFVYDSVLNSLMDSGTTNTEQEAKSIAIHMALLSTGNATTNSAVAAGLTGDAIAAKTIGELGDILGLTTVPSNNNEIIDRIAAEIDKVEQVLKEESEYNDITSEGDEFEGDEFEGDEFEGDEFEDDEEVLHPLISKYQRLAKNKFKNKSTKERFLILSKEK